MTKKSQQFPFVKAIYRKEKNPEYAGNPFIEALPSLPDDQQLTKALTYLPKFEPWEREAEAAYRIQRLRILKSVMVALPRVVRLARAMLKMNVDGYSARRPFSMRDNAQVRNLYKLQQKGAFVSVRDIDDAPQNSMALIGAAGCGKSFSLRHIAGMLPPVIYHEKLGKWQLPFVFVEMAYDGQSVHTLASSLFKAFDDLLPDGRLSDFFVHGRGNAEQRLAKALAIAHELGVGQIIIDESQNRRTVGNGGKGAKQLQNNAIKAETSLTKLLITASNTSHIPLLFSGTLEMQDTSLSRFSRARRMAGRGSAVWEPLTRHSEAGAQFSDFDLMLMALFKYQFVLNPTSFDANWANLFFDVTQGIPDLMVKVLESSQEAAIAAGVEKLTPEIVQNVVKKEFVMAETGVLAIKSKERFLLDAVPDLYRPDASEVFDSFHSLEAQSPLPMSASRRRKSSGQPSKTETKKPMLASPQPIELDLSDIGLADLRKPATAELVPRSEDGLLE